MLRISASRLYHPSVSESSISLRQFTLRVGIPVLALLLGWQLGIRYAQMQLEHQLQATGLFAVSATPVTGSGLVLSNPQRDADLSLLWRVWMLLNQNYVDPQKLQSNTLVRGAAEGLVRAVGDPYTVFMPPEENTEFRDSLSGNLQGIGAELMMRDDLVVVSSALKDSPAEKAGILPEDVILSVDGKPVDGLSLGEVVTLIRGPKDTTVKLTLARAKKTSPIELSIVRADIHVPSVEFRIIDSAKGPIGYVALNQFGDTSVAEIRTALDGFKTKKVSSIILDLRYNGGGYLDAAVDLVSMFVQQGKVVSVKHRDGAPEEHYVTGHPLFPTTPLVVMQNEGSASASEITAGALQDLGRATILGKKSFGKGTVQEVIDLQDGSSLRVTIAHWLTPKGKDLGKEGVHPDIEVERTVEDIQAKRDPQLDAAVEFLTTGMKPAAHSSSSASK